MPALPRLSGRETVRAFESLGWKVVRQKRSHIILIKVGHITTLSVPNHTPACLHVPALAQVQVRRQSRPVIRCRLAPACRRCSRHERCHGGLAARLHLPHTCPPEGHRDDVARKCQGVQANGVQVCSDWDFGLLPDAETVTELRRPEWCEAVDACRLLTSPTYHLLCAWQDLPALPYLGTVPAYITVRECRKGISCEN